MHHADPEADRVARSAYVHHLAVDQDLARIRMHQAVEDVHQRALARAVLSDQRVDLAPRDAEVHLVVGEHAGKLLGDAAHVYRDCLAVAHSEPGT